MQRNDLLGVGAACALGLSALVLATSARAAAATPRCPVLPAKERVAGYVWLNKGLSAEWSLLCNGAVSTGAALWAKKLHIGSSDPLTVAKYLASHLDTGEYIREITGTNPIGVKLMRSRIHPFLYDAFFTGFRLRGKP